MSQKSCILLLASLGFNTLAWSQPGFNKLYSQYSGIDNFSRLIVDNDTIICIGVAYDTTISPSPQQVLMVKTDTFGNIIQSKLYKDSLNGYLSMDITSGNIIKTSQGYFTFAVTVFGRASIQIIQIDKTLEVKSTFEFPIGDNYVDFYEQIIEIVNGGFMIAGNTMRSNQKEDGFIRRIDKYGNVLWFKYYGEMNKDESFRCMVKVSENRFVVGGSIGPNFNDGENTRAGLWAIDSNGVVLDTWVGPNNPNLIVITGLLPASDGGFVACGRTYLGEGSWGSKVQISLMKFNASLQLQWLKHIGPNSSNYNGSYDMIPTQDGNFIMAGMRTSYGDLTAPSEDWGGWLYKFSDQGDSIWSRADNAPPGYTPTGPYAYGGVGELSSGSIVAGGEGDIDNKFVGWVVKVTPDGCMDTLFCQTSKSEEVVVPTSIHLSPNPANNAAQIRFAQSSSDGSQLLLCDLAGRILLNQQIPAGVLEQTIQLSEYPSGWYFVTLLENGRVVLREKLVLIR
jgi:hypothetical protein